MIVSLLCDVCFPQDAAGEELFRAAGFLRERVCAGGHSAPRPARRSGSSERQLQNRGQTRPGEVDPRSSAGEVLHVSLRSVSVRDT